jgi:hypothetical protein
MTSDFVPQHHPLIALTPRAIAQSRAVSARVADPQSRWQSYLTALALAGFCAWWEAESPPIRLHTAQARMVQPSGFDLPGAVTHLLLNQFRVCLIVASADPLAAVEIPPAAIDSSHFYVAIIVHEEAGQVEMLGFQRQDQISPVAMDQHYEIERSQFDPNLDHLLLFVTGLQPSAIPLPMPTVRSAAQIMMQASHNTVQWVQQQLEQMTGAIAQLSDQILLAEPLPAYGLRSPGLRDGTEIPIKRILIELRRQGHSIPNDVRTTYQDLIAESCALRVSLVVWTLPEQEWSLLCILESLDRSVPAGGVHLSIQANQEIVAQTALGKDPYAITQAIGTLDEQFLVTIHFPTGDLTLPPFVFQTSAL